MIDKYNIGGGTGMNKPVRPAQSECNGLLVKLSPVMQDAYDQAKAGDGKIKRSPGGYWWPTNCKYSFGTTTIEALIARGAATYTEWKDSKRGRFPVEATIVR